MRRVDFISLVEDYKVLFLDSYGVLKNHEGLIEGVSQTIDYLRDRGKIVRILTNDASRSRQQQVDLFNSLGLNGLSME